MSSDEATTAAKLARRRAHDEAALARATPRAKRAAVELLSALMAQASPAVIKAKAEAALNDIALVWEAANHLTQK